MSVRLAARALLFNRHAVNGLMGSVFRRDRDKGDSFVTDVRIPMVDYASDYTQQELQTLEPGRYLLQASLPNGRVITRNFAIEDGKDTEVILDIPHEGPHEWSTLHAMTGQFSAESAKTARFAKSLSDHASLYADMKDHPEQGYALALMTPESAPSGEVFMPGETNERLSQLISADLDVATARAQLGSMQLIDHPSLQDEDFAIFRFGHSGFLDGESMDDAYYQMGPGSGIDRHYLVQQSSRGAQLICLPTPWMTPDGQVEVELLVKMYSLGRELEYSLTIGDPMVNSALGYINMGAVHLAQGLIDIEHARDMLFHKVSYPLAATIGGYMLVLGRNVTRYRSESDAWKNWVNNLDNWFDWLPDGAILNATMQLMDADPDYDVAYQALMRAYERGLPYFTFGLKHLRDGLRFFASRDDSAAQQRLDTLEPIAMHTDPGVPFLAVTFSQRWEQRQEPATLQATHA